MATAQRQTWSWHFDVPPEKIWPALADTARFNEAQAFPKHRIETAPQPDGTVIYTGRAKLGPFEITWRDVPQEWVTNSYFRHTRQFHNGPLRVLTAEMQLKRDGGGTKVDFTLEVEPANLLGRLLLLAGFFRGAKKNMTRLTAEAAEFAAGQREEPFTMPVVKLPAEVAGRLNSIAEALKREEGVAPALVNRLIRFIAEGPEVDLQRIRPLRLARKWQAPERDVIELCLRAVRAGLLTLRWDVLCPNCRGGAAGVHALDELPRGAHCPSCNVDYERDFTRNVELAFRPNPAIRQIPDGEFCLFGPMTIPHVIVQQTMQPGETRDLPADLKFGDYRLRPLNGPAQTPVSWTAGGFPELIAENGAVRAGPAATPGRIKLVNRESHEQTVVVESRDWVKDALTAHRATSMQMFRDLFGTETLRPGDEASIGQVTLMFTDLKGSTALYARIGDAAAYHLVREHFAFLAKTIRESDGAIVKTIGDAVMASFTEPLRAVEAALEVQRNVMGFNRRHAGGADDLVIKVGLHAGACIAVNLNGRLDYFGSAVNLAARLEGQSEGGDIVLSAALASDPAVAARLTGLRATPETAQVKGFDAPVAFHRLRL